jgi:hypothetical protein
MEDIREALETGRFAEFRRDFFALRGREPTE